MSPRADDGDFLNTRGPRNADQSDQSVRARPHDDEVLDDVLALERGQPRCRRYSLRMPSGEMTVTPTLTSAAACFFVRCGRGGRRVKRFCHSETSPSFHA